MWICIAAPVACAAAQVAVRRRRKSTSSTVPGWAAWRLSEPESLPHSLPFKFALEKAQPPPDSESPQVASLRPVVLAKVEAGRSDDSSDARENSAARRPRLRPAFGGWQSITAPPPADAEGSELARDPRLVVQDERPGRVSARDRIYPDVRMSVDRTVGKIIDESEHG